METKIFVDILIGIMLFELIIIVFSTILMQSINIPTMRQFNTSFVSINSTASNLGAAGNAYIFKTAPICYAGTFQWACQASNGFLTFINLIYKIAYFILQIIYLIADSINLIIYFLFDLIPAILASVGLGFLGAIFSVITGIITFIIIFYFLKILWQLLGIIAGVAGRII